jgi:hypothetical protein
MNKERNARYNDSNYDKMEKRKVEKIKIFN